MSADGYVHASDPQAGIVDLLCNHCLKPIVPGFVERDHGGCVLSDSDWVPYLIEVRASA